MNKPDSNYVVCYSPTHTSRQVAHAVAKGIGMARRIEIDLTLDEREGVIEIEDAVVIIAVPVYAGRVAPTALQRIKRLRGKNCASVLLAVYGNRDYEDALVELRDETVRLGFTPLAAGAFIGEHSYSRPEMPIAKGRPDAEDLLKAKEFGEACRKKLQEGDVTAPFFIKGNVPYRYVAPSTPAAPVCTEQCGACGACIDVCPTHAIAQDEEGRIITDVNRCTKCCACVKECSNEARRFDTPYTAMLHEKCAERREAELYL